METKAFLILGRSRRRAAGEQRKRRRRLRHSSPTDFIRSDADARMTVCGRPPWCLLDRGLGHAERHD